MPLLASRDAKAWGGCPVARNAPRTLPCSSIVRCSKMKMSCVVMTVPFHPRDLGERHDPARAVRQTLLLHDDVERPRDGLANGLVAHVRHADADHRLEARQRVTRVVGVHRGERAIVTGVHGGEHVDGLTTTNLAQDDAVGTHPQAVLHQVTLTDLPLAFEVGGPRLEANDVVLLQLQLGRVLDGDDSLGVGNERTQHVEQRRLARAGAAADDDVEAASNSSAENLEDGPGTRPQRHEVFSGDRDGSEPSNRDARTIERQRRNDRVEARTVVHPSIDHRGSARRLDDRPPRRCAR